MRQLTLAEQVPAKGISLKERVCQLAVAQYPGKLSIQSKGPRHPLRNYAFDGPTFWFELIKSSILRADT
jgi:hypothetical protein